jgi:nicotinate-nucleotide--dimethylbenzimidazole phosphoribosyltransferase
MHKIKETIKNITEIDTRLMDSAQERLNNLTKPRGSLGRLEELARLIVGITGKREPEFKNKVIFTLAADHGVTEEGVSAYPKEVTAQMVYNFLNQGAGINVLAKHVGARVVVIDMGVAEKINPSYNLGLKPKVCLRVDTESGVIFPRPKGRGMNAAECIKNPRLPAGGQEKSNFKDKKINYGTKNIAKGPAMTRLEAIKSIETGIEVFEDEFSRNSGIPPKAGKKGIDIIGTGEMGIGNTTAASAITVCFTKRRVEEVTGRGTGLDDKGLKNKIRVIKKSISINKPKPSDPIDVLSKVGGFEIGGLAGIILAAAAKRIPIVIDGFISTAAALIAFYLEPKTKNYMIAAHRSVEKGHRVILEHLGLRPLLDLGLRLGEGTGAALGIAIAEASIKVLTQMATFKSAHVSEGKK